MDTDTKRRKTLEEHLAKDYELLNKYEDEHRYEIDPKRKTKLESDIREIKDLIGLRKAELEPYLHEPDERLHNILDLYVARSFEGDRFAELDQAGETDPDRSTLLEKVFIDLNVKIRKGTQPRATQPTLLGFQLSDTSADAESISYSNNSLSAMDLLLKHSLRRVVFIGGPGHGKSTLGQYIAQVHRAYWLGEPYDYTPETLRLPFRIILKYLAQWLSDRPPIDNIETYLASQIVSRFSGQTASPEDIQKTFRSKPCLLILDGLDEVVSRNLRKRILSRIREFLNRMDKLGTDLFVIATSRPTGYTDQFDPYEFWHFDLQTLTPAQVTKFAEKWVQAKKVREEEISRILRTLKECQSDPSLASLLATPLQVTIVLLIIKDGGRPPSQREALFNEYWSTIFRREKSKDKGIIQSDEPLLFELHAFLGYILHRRAEQENVQSLLPEGVFREAIREYLRKDDSHSSEEFINRKLEQLVSDARERLVLIVEPEPGRFGFELRSLQEFFAAVHLVQTARETAKRFERLKLIARSPHWRNVALFAAGRISRNNSGEASNILELVCRPLDHKRVDRYFRRGAWLALEIAADSALGNNRDLQYNALEFGLEVLETGTSFDQQRNLSSLTAKLSLEDKRDILQPILEEQLRSLPPSRLLEALDLYTQHFSSTALFMEKVDVLLGSEAEDRTQRVLNIVLRTQPDAQRLAEQLRAYWPKNKEFFWQIWQSTSPGYLREIIQKLNVPAEQMGEIIKSVIEGARSRPLPESDRGSSIEKLRNELFLLDLTSMYDQLLAVFLCIDAGALVRDVGYIPVKRVSAEANPHRLSVLELMKERASLDTDKKLIDLLRLTDLTPLLKVQLWRVYWNYNKPDSTSLSLFFNDLEDMRQVIPNIHQEYYVWIFGETWPLLKIAIRRKLSENSESYKQLMPILEANNQVSATEQTIYLIQEQFEQASADKKRQLIIALALKSGVEGLLPQLKPIAGNVGISVDELISAYDFMLPHELIQRFSVDEANQILSIGESTISDSDKLYEWFYFIYVKDWPLVPEVTARIKAFLITCLNLCSSDTFFIPAELVLYFFVRLYGEPEVQVLAPQVFICLAKNLEEESSMYDVFDEIIQNLPPESFITLSEYLSHENEEVQKGAAKFWKLLAGIDYDDDAEDEDPINVALNNINIDADSLFHLMDKGDWERFSAGVQLFTFSRFPLEEAKIRKDLRSRMSWPLRSDEEYLWSNFLLTARVVDSDIPQWCTFLQRIIIDSQKFNDEIVAAARQRYKSLIDDDSITFSEAKERLLGLPLS